MSSSNESNDTKTPYEMFSDSEDTHPIDTLVTTRLPQAELRARIRDAVDELMRALGERASLWGNLEELLNERVFARNEEYFNVGYEYGLAAGRAEALERLDGSGDPDARRLAERLRALVKEHPLPSGSMVAALLETAWVFALDSSATRPAESGA